MFCKVSPARIATPGLRLVAIIRKQVDENSGFCQRFCIFAGYKLENMPTIKKSLSSKVDGDGKSEILLRFSGGRDAVFRVKSGIRIPPTRWNVKESRIIIPRLETSEQRDLVKAAKELDDVCNLLIEAYTAADKTTVSREWFADILDRYRHPEKNTPSGGDFFGAFEKFLGDNESSRPRENHFKVLERQLRRFELYSGREWKLDTVSADDLAAFKDFLVNEHAIFKDKKFEFIYTAVPESRTPGPRGYNAIGNSLRLFRTFFNWCIKHRLTTNYPFREYSIEAPVYGTPYYITLEERERIAVADLSSRPQVATQRDVFVFHCCIGCRVGDLLRLTRANVIDGAVEYIARKTSGERPVTACCRSYPPKSTTTQLKPCSASPESTGSLRSSIPGPAGRNNGRCTKSPRPTSPGERSSGTYTNRSRTRTSFRPSPDTSRGRRRFTGIATLTNK